MNVRDLTHAEWLAYEAGKAVAAADRWRAQAEESERAGHQGAAGISREAEREAQAEANDAWHQLAALKEHKRALEGMN